MTHYWGLSVLFLALASLLSCGRPPDQAFDKAANSGLKTILLLEIPDSTYYVYTDANTGPMPLDTDFAHHANVNKELITNLRAELEHRGFEVEVSSFLPRIVSEAGIDSETRYYYEDIETHADAIMHLEMNAGYTVAGFPREYRPWVRVSARLLAGSTKKQLFFQRLSYGGAAYPGDNHFPSPRQDAFPNADAVLENRGAAATRLQVGARVLAAGIAQQLR